MRDDIKNANVKFIGIRPTKEFIDKLKLAGVKVVDGVEAFLQRVPELAKLPPKQYFDIRDREARWLGLNDVKTLDDAYWKAKKELKVDNVKAVDGEAVDGSKLLSDVIAAIRSYVVMSDESAIVAGLWAFHTYLTDASFHTPYLLVTSPEPGCGKSTLQRVLKELTNNPIKSGNMSSSALFRAIANKKPTLFIDEADTFVKKGSDYEGTINEGHAKDGVVYRNKETDKDWEEQAYPVFCPKCLAFKGKDNIWDALQSRSIEVQLKKKKPNEETKKFRPEKIDELVDLKQRIQQWTADNIKPLMETEVEIPTELQNRVEDNWEPLLNIANIISRDWYKKAVEAAIASLPNEEEKELSLGEQLLRDCQIVFNLRDNEKKEYMRLEVEEYDRQAEGLIYWLSKIEGSDWGTRNYGKPITTSWFARKLRQYGIHSEKHTKAGPDHGRMVWYRQKFEDAWARYLPPLEASTASTSSTVSIEDQELKAKPEAEKKLSGLQGLSSVRAALMRDMSESKNVTEEAEKKELGIWDLVDDYGRGKFIPQGKLRKHFGDDWKFKEIVQQLKDAGFVENAVGNWVERKSV